MKIIFWEVRRFIGEKWIYGEPYIYQEKKNYNLIEKNDVKGKENQKKGKKIMVQNKEIEEQDNEKEKKK